MICLEKDSYLLCAKKRGTTSWMSWSLLWIFHARPWGCDVNKNCKYLLEQESRPKSSKSLHSLQLTIQLMICGGIDEDDWIKVMRPKDIRTAARTICNLSHVGMPAQTHVRKLRRR